MNTNYFCHPTVRKLSSLHPIPGHKSCFRVPGKTHSISQGCSNAKHWQLTVYTYRLYHCLENVICSYSGTTPSLTASWNVVGHLNDKGVHFQLQNKDLGLCKNHSAKIRKYVPWRQSTCRYWGQRNGDKEQLMKAVLVFMYQSPLPLHIASISL